MEVTQTERHFRKTPVGNIPGLHPLIQSLLKKRGLDTKEAIEEFFSWDLKTLPSLTQLKGLKKATERIVQAIENGEQIGVYGDYDVDGTTSCALLYYFFKMLDTQVVLFQPSRFDEGYGVHPSSIDNAIAAGVKVLITVDCGISNLETAEYALDKDIDLIITDHHKDAKAYMPKAYAVVNPNRRDEETSDDLKSLAGVGVAFSLCLSLKFALEEKGIEIPSLYSLLQFVAIGSICDLANMGPTNLKLTRHGLKQIPKTEIPGLKLFLKEEDFSKNMIESEKCSFFIGPCINSKGRLDHPEFALNLLTTQNPDEAKDYFRVILDTNEERKRIQKQVYEEAFQDVVSSLDFSEPLINVVYRPHWHEGVIGIVASKLVETFNVPAIVFTDSEEPGVIKASARTAGELNIFDCLDQCKDLFLKFGGHKAAAGLSMKSQNLQALREKLNSLLKNIPEIIRVKQDYFDLEVSIFDLDMQLAQSLQLMEPFGNGNSYPIFRIRDAYLSHYTILKDAHVKWVLTSKKKQQNLQKNIHGISFNYIGKWNAQDPDDLFQNQDQQGLTVDGKLSINHFNGRKYLQMMVDKITTQF
ncbi:MAG: single-stranded-DNA-specific exonuclease RecJ [Halobacteriovoraceae bacterium]|nr:single-stranded-DNA-specific exonuclease RecJ [Halobacteriovoraceae bacterium]